MSCLSRIVLAAMTFVALCLGSATSARADTITLTAGPLNGDRGVFNFIVPAGYQITSATLRSTSVIMYLTQSLPTVDFRYRLDGQNVGRDTITLLRPSPGETLIHNYRFNVTNLSLLQDGVAVFSTVIDVSPFGSANAFTANSILEVVAVAAAPVPEPAMLLLFGTGLAGVGAKVRKRRKV